MSDRVEASYRLQMTLYKGIALDRLRRFEEAKSEWNEVQQIYPGAKNRHYHQNDDRLRARLMAHDGRVVEAMDLLESYWRGARQTDAQNYSKSIVQLTRELRDHVESLKLSLIHI